MDKDKKPMHVRETPMTYDDYANLPDDGNRYELADGVLELMSPSPTSMHQMVCSKMLYLINMTCQSDYIILAAPLDVILSSTEVRQPDLVMIHRSRLSIVKKRGIVGAPDLVVEILSPFSLKCDKVRKRHVYAKYGIQEYWIVDPKSQTLEQYMLTSSSSYELVDVYAQDDPVRSEQVKCLAFTMNDVMSRIPDLPD